MRSFEIPNKLFGIHMDAVITTTTRSYFIEYLEILPHIKKYAKDNRSVWYIFESSGFIRNIFNKFLEKNIGNKVLKYPWKSCIAPTYHIGPIMRVRYAKPVDGEHTYSPHTIWKKQFDDAIVTLSTQQLYNLTN